MVASGAFLEAWLGLENLAQENSREVTLANRSHSRAKVTAAEYDKHKEKMESLGLDPSDPAPCEEFMDDTGAQVRHRLVGARVKRVQTHSP